ncbi:uncharacterized protein LOC111054046 [Nilaparvata lugens]|uniref:uncharacterized protein LOC111054046 n=1 Tax=Nilaparvata lugens TaxID=108931 RepID=UPI00193EC15E|nr:uncharacterized protein LOC111054046 [Nilaparvata lugens]
MVSSVPVHSKRRCRLNKRNKRELPASTGKQILSLMGLLMIGVILGSILTDESIQKSDKPVLPTAVPPDERLFISYELSVAFAIFLPLAPAVVGILSLFLLIGTKKRFKNVVTSYYELGEASLLKKFLE